MKTIAKILICYNSPVSIFSIYNGKPSADNSAPNDLSESGFSLEIHKIKKYLLENFNEVSSFALNNNLDRTINKLVSYSPDVVFNFVESIDGVASHEYCLAGLFEMLGLDFTGNLPASLGNCLNKARAKTILRSFGINTPASIIINLEQSEKLDSGNFRTVGAASPRRTGPHRQASLLLLGRDLPFQGLHQPRLHIGRNRVRIHA